MSPAQLTKRIVIALMLAVALLYIGDTLTFFLRGRHPTVTQPVETFTVPRILAIDQKGGKIEYAVDQTKPEQTFSCVHTIFPHAGFSPCWYIMKKAGRPIPVIAILPKSFS